VRRYVYPLEIGLAAWIAVWVVTGWLVYHEVQGLGKLGQTVVLAGDSIDQTGVALDSFKDLPFVGNQVARVSANARRTARSAKANGRSAQDDVDRLAILLWIVVAVTPTVPVVLWYGWLRHQTVAPVRTAG
jgi:hypothetical protein